MSSGGGDNSRASIRLSKALGEAIVIKAVRLHYYGSCLEEEYPPVKIPGSDNNMPIIRNPIDVINITAGEFLQFKVPRVRLLVQGLSDKLRLHSSAYNSRTTAHRKT